MTQSQSEAILAKAKELGFVLCGISGDVATEQITFHEWWVDQGYHAGMAFLLRQREKRKSITQLLPGAQSAIVCAVPFPGVEELPGSQLNSQLGSQLAIQLGLQQGLQLNQTAHSLLHPTANESGENKNILGKVSRYAVHNDYHNTLMPKLNELAAFVDNVCSVEGSLAYIDTGAVSERTLAVQAGLGWIGKNAMLISREYGSWFWLCEIITKAKLAPATEIKTDHCGKCRRCIEACPTGAIVENKRAIDSNKCLAYLNIEHRGEIPPQYHKPMSDWILGCDICQEVCPWNAQSLRTGRSAMGEPQVEYLSVDEILQMNKQQFKEAFKARAHSRAKHAGLQRNAKIIKENNSG